MVYSERQGVNFETLHRSRFEYSVLDQWLLEQQYERFLRWWEENSFHFSTLSFNIKNQSQQFIKDLNDGVGFETAFLKIRSDLWGYYLEYIRQEAILPFTNRLDENGRLVGDFYGDKPIVDLIDEREREGVVKKAMIDLEEKLNSLSPDQFIIRASPKGWTNMGYEYTETQFQVFWRDGEVVRGLTIRTGADLEAVINLFDQLGIKFSQTKEKELLKEVTETNLVLESTTLKDIVELISSYSSGQDHQGRELIPQYQRWRENDGHFERYDQLVFLLKFLEDKVKDMIVNNEFSKERLESLLGFVLTVMAEKERWEKEGKLPHQLKPVLMTTDTYYPPIDSSVFITAVDYLRGLPGCAGGGSFSSDQGIYLGLRGDFILTSFGISGVDNSKNEKNRLECVTCPFCQKVVDAEIVSKDGQKFIHCPSCGAMVEKN